MFNSRNFLHNSSFLQSCCRLFLLTDTKRNETRDFSANTMTLTVEEPTRIKFLRVLPIFGILVNGETVQKNRGAFGDEVAIEIDVFFRRMGETEGN